MLKKLSTARGGGNGGTVLIYSWKYNYNIYLDIQAIPHFYAFYWFLMFNYWFLYNTLYKNRSPENLRFHALKSLLLPEFWTYNDGIRFILKRNEVRIQNYP